MVVLGILVGLLVLSFLVALHELGHALAARRNGVVVEEYAIGFPPTVWSKKLKSGVKFLINALPIGGYVKLQGEYDSANQKGDYGNAGYWGKTKILLAGVVTNLLIAVLLLTFLAPFGIPKMLENQVMNANDELVLDPVQAMALEEGGPAEQAGLKANDQILKLDGEPVLETADLGRLAEARAGETVEMLVRRDGAEQSLTVNIRSSDKPVDKGYLGIRLAQQAYIKTKWYRAPILAVTTTAQLSWETFKGVGSLITNFFGGLIQRISSDPAVREQGEASMNRAGDAVAGPIAMLGLIFPALLSTDLTTFVFFVALISLTLAVMNLLPIPGLDGGRWLLMSIFKLLKKPLTEEVENKVQGVGMMMLFTIMILVVISDVAKII